jgi:hypothetical protein
MTSARPSSGRRQPPPHSPRAHRPGLLRPRLLMVAFTAYCLVAKRSPWAAVGDCAAGGAALVRAVLAGAAATAAAPPPDAGDELAAAIRNATSDFQEVREGQREREREREREKRGEQKKETAVSARAACGPASGSVLPPPRRGLRGRSIPVGQR